MDEVGQKTGMVVLMYSEYQGGGGEDINPWVEGCVFVVVEEKVQG